MRLSINETNGMYSVIMNVENVKRLTAVENDVLERFEKKIAGS